MLICDTGGLLAWIDGDHSDHIKIRELMQSADAVTSPLVLAEFDYLLRSRFTVKQARLVLDAFFKSGVDIARLTLDEFVQAYEVDQKYAELNIGLADATVVLLAQKYKTLDVLTLDQRHFRAITPLQGGTFRLLPADI